MQQSSFRTSWQQCKSTSCFERKKPGHGRVFCLHSCACEVQAGLEVRNELMRSYSSSLSLKLRARDTSSTCLALRPPTIAALMPGLCSVQATATTPGLTLCLLPISRNSSTSLRRSEEHTSELQSLRHLVCR